MLPSCTELRSPDQGDDPSQGLLVVDSDVHWLYYVAKLLQGFGYTAATAQDAADALQLCGEAVPALVVAELDLPGLSGLELLRSLRRDRQRARIPVIAMTVSRDHGTEERCLRAGFAACLVKPVGAEDLYRAVRAVLDEEQRRVTRIEARIPVFVNDRPLDRVEGECASVISEHGMYIRTPRLHPMRTRLDIRMDVAGRTIRADAVVLYRHDQGEGPYGEPGMGLKFSWIAPGDREHLRTYITSRTGCHPGNGA